MKGNRTAKRLTASLLCLLLMAAPSMYGEEYGDVLVEESEEILPGEEALWEYVYPGTPNIYLETICDWLTLYHGEGAYPGSGMIPAMHIVRFEGGNRSDIRLYGQFAITDYVPEGDTLVAVQEEAFTGCMHIQQLSETEYMVVAAESLDAADLTGSAQVLAEDNEVLLGDLLMGAITEEERTQFVRDFIQANGLPFSGYTDLGGTYHALDPEAAPSPKWIETSLLAASTQQLITVEKTEGTNAVLRLHEKTEDGSWVCTLAVPAFIGREGLGKTREGDQRTPAGLFGITEAFGLAEDPGTSLPYTLCTEDAYWNTDSTSDRYNQLVDASTYAGFSVEDSEHIAGEPYAYRYAIALTYNEEGIPYAGSGIFLHCYKEHRFYTSGCIAVPEEAMVTLLTRLLPDARILIGDIRTLDKQYSGG